MLKINLSIFACPTWDLFRTTPFPRMLGKYGLITLLAQNLSLSYCRRQGMLALSKVIRDKNHLDHALYRSSGFVDIGPYAESEIPDEYKAYWVFMEKTLV